MLYTRSSFIRWLTKVKGCDVQPVRRSNAFIITNGIASAYMWVNPQDRIDYEEIQILCQKIYLELPGDKDLKKAE
jgi:hypothetical protein